MTRTAKTTYAAELTPFSNQSPRMRRPVDAEIMPDRMPITVVALDEEYRGTAKTPSADGPHLRGASRLSARARRAEGETIVSVLMAKTLAHPELVSLAAGFVDTIGLPVDTTMAAASAVLSHGERGRAALQYGTTAGFLPLRQFILDRLLAADGQTAGGTGLSVEQVVITAGSNQLLHHLGEVLLDPGDIVLCAAPSYFVFLGMIESLGGITVGVEADEHGIVPEALEETLAELSRAGRSARVKAIYVTSYFDNPAGVSVAKERRPVLLEIAKRYEVYLIEDVAYRELRYQGEDLPSLRCFDGDGDTVIQAGTFSKSFSPGIRIGWGILPRTLVAPVLTQKGHLDFGSANLNQMLMAEVFAQGQFDPHLERLRRCYREKMAVAVDAVDEFLGPLEGVEYDRPDGGLYVWLRLPAAIDTGLSGPLFDRAVREGVLYVPGQACYPRAGVAAAKNTIRLSFGMQSCESIRMGIEALGRAIRSLV